MKRLISWSHKGGKRIPSVSDSARYLHCLSIRGPTAHSSITSRMGGNAEESFWRWPCLYLLFVDYVCWSRGIKRFYYREEHRKSRSLTLLSELGIMVSVIQEPKRDPDARTVMGLLTPVNFPQPGEVKQATCMRKLSHHTSKGDGIRKLKIKTEWFIDWLFEDRQSLIFSKSSFRFLSPLSVFCFKAKLLRINVGPRKQAHSHRLFVFQRPLKCFVRHCGVAFKGSFFKCDHSIYPDSLSHQYQTGMRWICWSSEVTSLED